MARAHSSFGFSVHFIYFFLARCIPVVKGWKWACNLRTKHSCLWWWHPSSCWPYGQAAGGLCVFSIRPFEGTPCTHMPQPGTCLYHQKQSSVLCVCSCNGSLVFIIISSSVLVHGQWQGPNLIRHISGLEATWDCGNTWAREAENLVSGPSSMAYGGSVISSTSLSRITGFCPTWSSQ